MRVTATAVFIVLFSIASVCHAIDQELPAKLGIPVKPQDSGETYDPGLLNASFNMGLGGCGDIGINSSLSSLLDLAKDAAGNAKNLPQIAATALMAYFFPTEYSVTSNLLSDARKLLAILADKCKTYQAARDFVESQDVAGIRKASFAKCMQGHNGDDIFCSKPENAWYSMFGTMGCISVVDKSLECVKLPDGISKDFIKSFLGDVKMCAGGSGGSPPVMTAAKVYQANMLFYGPAIENAVAQAKKRYLIQQDIQDMKLCVGSVVNSNAGSNNGLICPNAQSINMLATFPDDEQAIFKRKLAEHLSLLETVRNAYSVSAVVNKAASNCNKEAPDTFKNSIAKLTEQSQKDVNDIVRLKIQAGGNTGDLSNWENRVMERNSYWQQRQQNIVKAKVQHESAYGSKGNDATDKAMQQDIQQDIKNSYNK